MTENAKKFIPVMLTPFTDNGVIDFNLLTKLTEFYLAAGAKGLFANCLSSEMFELSDEERIAITEHVVRISNGKVPVVATGTFARTLHEQTNFIKRIYNTGIQSVILTSGILVNEDEPDQVLEDKFYDILNATDRIPFGLYECPVPYKRLIAPELLKKFMVTNRLNYFKDTSLDIEQVKQKAAVGIGYDFGLYDAYIVHAVESLKSGSAGLSCIQGNFFPELIVWLCDNFDNNSLQQQVQLVQNFLTNHMDVMHDIYPTAAKLYLNFRGLDITGFSRRKTGAITNQQMAKLQKLYKDYANLESALSLTSVL
ncbi:dihydrodipicolinate synthase family protein [Mucilaginibacter sabulilitoris]|uniref:Dihydrodipicolinate synthase family protein n=1 Tax=Mucilaginibacter sabulilitoris TaxID=1173583 RepID=A0ABZ0TT31_9SPHI|nr:dihydrodipicolinate synthase family protein [Mucilaginibacter sabulilitoris]WPU96242.1 dihydrodipicolinate synthase family protein [Mucilaginibacter sabulilitoris]